MATIIDSLVVKLGLDPRDFTKGQKQAAQSLIDTKTEVKSAADDIGKSIASMTKQFVGFFVVIKSFQDLIRHFERISAETRQLGLDSKNLGIAAAELKDWQNAAELAGGSAEDVNRTIESLQKSIFDLNYSGQVSDQIVWLTRLGVQFETTAGKARPFNDVMMDVAKAIESRHLDNATATQYLRAAGFDQGSINLIESGTKALKEYIDEQRRQPQATDEQVRASARMEIAWGKVTQRLEGVARQIITDAEPAITMLFKAFGKGIEWINNNQGKIDGWLNKIVEWFTGDGPTRVRTGIGGLIDDFASLTRTIKSAAEAWDSITGKDKDDWFRDSANYVHDFVTRAWDIEHATPDKYRDAIQAAAIKYGIPAEDLARLLQRESGFDPSKVGAAGERGIGQLRPEYHPNAGKDPNADIFEVARTLAENATYYARHMKEFGLKTSDDILNAAFAAYNAGPGRTTQALRGKRALPGSTRAYVDAIRGSGAASSLQSKLPTVNGNTTSNNIDVGHISVYTQATDAAGIAGDLRAAISRKFNVGYADPGLA